MRRFIALMALVALVAACGGDAADKTTTTTAAAVTTTAPGGATTTIAETSTTLDEAAVRVAAAEALVGSYDGEWRNLTFGSSGSAEATMELNGSVATMTMTLGGNVFGGSAPPPVVMDFDLSSPPPYMVTSDLFGEVTVEVDLDGNLVFGSESIESLGGMSLVVDGTVTATGFDLEYSIFGTDGSLFAEGEFDMPKVG